MVDLNGRGTGLVGTWPKVNTEEAYWTPDPHSTATNRERKEQTGPYSRSIPAFITEARLEITANQAADIEEVSSEIVRFDSEMGREIGPYGAVLLRSEAMSSSRIEQLSASATAIATAEAGVGKSNNAEMIVANTRAMQVAIAKAESLNEDAILATHRVLTQKDAPKIAGLFRDRQNWIGPGNAGPRIAYYVPPAHQRIPELMSDLVSFMRRNDLPVLSVAALSHAQFETIHPFEDGNGRTGRALIHAVWRERGLTQKSTVPFSAGLLADPQRYFDALTRYRSGETDPMMLVMTESTRRAIVVGRELVRNLRDIRSGWDERLKVRRSSSAWKLADVLISHPVVTRQLAANELGVHEGTVERAIEPLVAAGILTESGSEVRGRRVWRSQEVLQELDDFGERLGRRISHGG